MFVSNKSSNPRCNLILLAKCDLGPLADLLLSQAGSNNNTLSIRDINNSTLYIRDINTSTLSTRDINNSSLFIRDINNSTFSIRDINTSTLSIRDTNNSTLSIRDINNSTVSQNRDIKNINHVTLNLHSALKCHILSNPSSTRATQWPSLVFYKGETLEINT
ncbi:tripartite motif-containing 35 [Plakobranchus ocellatus]|uniref:Tripartite motif-containing 35 n=1 Tax=Plakobranchus ocellatus TaxID=259542 RepID=A0AAV3ZJJ4_9GAST|nr:tripartite motif-containing 35 [Plakobranchus ocellatus]